MFRAVKCYEYVSCPTHIAPRGPISMYPHSDLIGLCDSGRWPAGRVYASDPLIRKEQQSHHCGKWRADTQVHVSHPWPVSFKPGERDPDREKNQKRAREALIPGL